MHARIITPPLEKTMNFLRDASRKAEGRAGKIYRSQTSMLQWLRRKGHRVDFAPIPTFEPQPMPNSYVPPGTPLLKQFDGKPCPYCANTMKRGTTRMPTRDHVRPRRAGATLANGNCLVVCAPCNGDKGDMILPEFIAWLEKKNDYRRANIVRETIRRMMPQEEVRIGNTVIVFDDDEEWEPTVDMQQPPAIYYMTTTDQNIFKQPKTVLTITAGGQVMRGETPLESLSKEQLIVVVNELIDLIRKK